MYEMKKLVKMLYYTLYWLQQATFCKANPMMPCQLREEHLKEYKLYDDDAPPAQKGTHWRVQTP